MRGKEPVLARICGLRRQRQRRAARRHRRRNGETLPEGRRTGGLGRMGRHRRGHRAGNRGQRVGRHRCDAGVRYTFHNAVHHAAGAYRHRFQALLVTQGAVAQAGMVGHQFFRRVAEHQRGIAVAGVDPHAVREGDAIAGGIRLLGGRFHVPRVIQSLAVQHKTAHRRRRVQRHDFLGEFLDMGHAGRAAAQRHGQAATRYPIGGISHAAIRHPAACMQMEK